MERTTYTTKNRNTTYASTIASLNSTIREEVYEHPSTSHRRETSFADGSRLVTESSPLSPHKATVTYHNPQTGNVATSVYDRVSGVSDAERVIGHTRVVEDTPIHEERTVTTYQEDLGDRRVYTTVTRSPSRYSSTRDQVISSTVYDDEPARKTVLESEVIDAGRKTSTFTRSYVGGVERTETRTHITRSPAREIVTETVAGGRKTTTYVDRSPVREVVTSTYGPTGRRTTTYVERSPAREIVTETVAPGRRTTTYVDRSPVREVLTETVVSGVTGRRSTTYVDRSPVREVVTSTYGPTGRRTTTYVERSPAREIVTETVAPGRRTTTYVDRSPVREIVTETVAAPETRTTTYVNRSPAREIVTSTYGNGGRTTTTYTDRSPVRSVVSSTRSPGRQTETTTTFGAPLHYTAHYY